MDQYNLLIAVTMGFLIILGVVFTATASYFTWFFYVKNNKKPNFWVTMLATLTFVMLLKLASVVIKQHW